MVWDDDRGQSIQVGAVLLFGVLIISFSLYQAFIVPNQNKKIEANHLQTVEGDMQDLRNGIVNVPKTGDGDSVTIQMGETLPARAIALNPPSPSGQLSTVGTDDDRVNLTIANARAIDDETADYWTGTTQTRETGAIEYRPNYYEFRNAPDIVYDNTVLFNRFTDSSLTVSGQQLIDGKKLTLVALDGSYDRGSSRAESVDIEAVSGSTTDVGITNETGENVLVTFSTQRSASEWESLLRDDGQFVGQGGYVVDVTPAPNDTAFERVTLELQQSHTYTLRMAKVGMGTDVTQTDAEYLTNVGVTDGEYTVEVRDEYNNPIRGEPVTILMDGTEVDDSPQTSDDEGQVSYIPKDNGNLVFKSGNQEKDKVTFSVSSDTQKPAYEVFWNTEAFTGGNVDCDGNICTVKKDEDVIMEGQTDPDTVKGRAEFGLENNDVGTLDTYVQNFDSTNIIQNEFSAEAIGETDVYVFAGDDRDTVTFEVIDTPVLEYDGSLGPGNGKFDFRIVANEDVTVQEFSVDGTGIDEDMILNAGGRSAYELEITRGDQTGIATQSNGNDFIADGSERYDLEADSQANDGQYAILPSGDDYYGVYLEGIKDGNNNLIDLNDLEATDASNAELTITFGLENHPDQKFYFKTGP